MGNVIKNLKFLWILIFIDSDAYGIGHKHPIVAVASDYLIEEFLEIFQYIAVR